MEHATTNAAPQGRLNRPAADNLRATFIDRGSPFDSRIRLYHRDRGFYEMSARDVRNSLDLMFRGGSIRSRLARLYRHARRADCLVTRYA